MKAERLLMQLQRETVLRFQREVDDERQEVIRQKSSLESKSDQCRRKLRELRAKTSGIENELTFAASGAGIPAASKGHYGTARSQYDAS